MLKRLVKSRNVLKRKFQSIKMGEGAKSTELKNTFKPITEPINKLLKLSTENTSKMIMPKKEKMEMYRDYESNGRIKSNRGQKYKKIIKNIIEDTHSGKGLLTINPGKPNYIYWDDPNELIERLKLLLASQQAGNNNHTNEIVSIIEELREGNIIY